MRGLAEVDDGTVASIPSEAESGARAVAVAEADREDVGHLLVAHREGDTSAFPKLVQRYRRSVFGYLVHSGVAESDRDDLFQDVFIKVHQSAHRYDAERPLHPWLFTVVANTVRNYLRKQRVRRLFVSESSSPVDPAVDGEKAAQARGMARWLEGAIASLPVTQRQVLVLATLENLKLNEIASVLGMPLNTVKTNLRRARLSLVEGVEARERESAAKSEKTS
jgi:RNA polymerase sigma-70 factor (ECF subfamily)